MSYAAYAARLVAEAKKAQDADIAEKNRAVARRKAKRSEMQPQYTEVDKWVMEEIRKNGGIANSSDAIDEGARRIAELDAIVSNA